MGGTIALVIYVIGFFATPYVMGRFTEYDNDFCIWFPMLLWPLFAVVAIPQIIGSLLLDLGYRHHR